MKQATFHTSYQDICSLVNPQDHSLMNALSVCQSVPAKRCMTPPEWMKGINPSLAQRNQQALLLQNGERSSSNSVAEKASWTAVSLTKQTQPRRLQATCRSMAGISHQGQDIFKKDKITETTIRLSNTFGHYLIVGQGSCQGSKQPSLSPWMLHFSHRSGSNQSTTTAASSS